jgi:hypothetical protein
MPWTEEQVKDHNERVAKAEALARRHARDLDIKPHLGCTLKEWNESQERRAEAEAAALRFAQAASRRSVSDPQLELDKAKALVRPIPRETSRLDKTVVRFVGRRTRLLDPDNFAGSVKDLLDGLQEAGLIHGDSLADITLITEQEKVAHVRDEETIIEITYP